MTNQGALLDAIDKYFSEDEVNAICFTLKIDYENLKGLTKNAKIRSLIEQLIREESISNLADVCNKKRPKVDFYEILYGESSLARDSSIGKSDQFEKEKTEKPLEIGKLQLNFSEIAKAIGILALVVVIIVNVVRFFPTFFLAVTPIPETPILSTITMAPTLTPMLPTNTLAPILTPLSPASTVAIASPISTETNTPSLTPTSSPTVTPSPEYEREVLSIGWPSYCVKNTIGEQLILQLKPTDDPIACLNPKVYQETGDFLVEWNVRIGGVAAILLVGNESNEYWLGVLPQSGQIHFQIIDRENQESSWDDKGYYDAPTLRVGEPNEIQFVRTNSEIILYINGERIYVGNDEIFKGEIATIQVGVGASGQSENVEDDTIVTFDNVSISFPVQE